MIGRNWIIKLKIEKQNEKLGSLLKRFNTLFLNWFSNQMEKIHTIE